jgi:chromosome segregation ATPase
MSEAIKLQIAVLEQQLVELIQVCDTLRKEKAVLENQLDKLKTTLEDAEKMPAIFSDRRALKNRINAFIREIDKCLASLEEKQEGNK